MSSVVVVDGLHERLNDAAGSRSYKHLGELTGTNAESVRRYMQGQAPSVEFLSRLCEALGLSADWLLLGRGPMRAEEVRGEALRSADPAELLSAMSGTMEALCERVDRIERFVQTLETRLRARPSGVDHAEQASPVGGSKASRIAAVVAQRPPSAAD